jgi:uncharacterized protein (DUF2141 family)
MNRSSFITLIVFALLWASGPCMADEGTLILTVKVKGALPNTGQIFLSLFASEDDYLKEPLKYKEIKVDDSGEVLWSFKDLQAGTYAVSAIYDKNGNGKLDTGFLKIPKEPIGMSNDAKGTFGPPSFKKTSFPLKSSSEITIHLAKVKD